MMSFVVGDTGAFDLSPWRLAAWKCQGRSDPTRFDANVHARGCVQSADPAVPLQLVKEVDVLLSVIRYQAPGKVMADGNELTLRNLPEQHPIEHKLQASLIRRT